MKIMYNLHNHTFYSDGELSFSQIIDLNRGHQIKYLSITDHNSIRAYMDNIVIFDDEIKIIPGVELETEKGKFEVIGLNIDTTNTELNDYCLKCEQERGIQLLQWINAINKRFGSSISLEMIKQNDKRFMLSKKKLSILCNNLYPSLFPFKNTIKDFLDTINNEIKPIQYKNLKDTISLIHNAHGVAVLPHPLHFFERKKGVRKWRDLYKFLKELKKIGLDGVETQRCDVKFYEECILSFMAKKLGLFQSGGSDFHLLKDRKSYKWYDKKNKKPQLCFIKYIEGHSV